MSFVTVANPSGPDKKTEPPNVIEKKSATKQEKKGGEAVPDWEVVHSGPGEENMSNGEARIEGVQQGGTVEPQHAWSKRSQFKWDVNWGGRKYTIISWDFTVKF